MMIGNMGDVASLSDKLALMPDQQLPRLAQQYKGDAITLSLILGEKNRRERLRSAASTQASQQQPKVNDQIVASMQPQQLPENIGIGALPAQNMQQMADGGIAGYADDDAQLAYNNEPVMRMAEGGIARYAGGGITQEQVQQAYNAWMAAQPSWYQQQTPLSSQREADAKANYERVLAQFQSQPSNVQPGAPVPPSSATSGNETRRAQAPAPSAPKAAPVPTTGGVADLVSKKPEAAPAPAATAAPKLDDTRKQFIAEADKLKPDTEKAEDYMTRRKTMLGDEDKALSKYEAKLLAQEAAAPREKDESFWMAVTQAGLAAAAGSSPHALKNIAEGFGTGVAGYKDALKDFKKAENERTKAMAEIEQARRAEKRGDVDAALAHEDKSQTRMDNFNHYKMSGLASIAGATISGQYSLAGHQVSAAATREGNQIYRQASLDQRDRAQVEAMRKDIETRLLAADQVKYMGNAALLEADTNRQLQQRLQQYPDLAKYAVSPTGASQFNAADQALVNKYATPPR